jgi:hypothetical protein
MVPEQAPTSSGASACTVKDEGAAYARRALDGDSSALRSSQARTDGQSNPVPPKRRAMDPSRSHNVGRGENAGCLRRVVHESESVGFVGAKRTRFVAINTPMTQITDKKSLSRQCSNPSTSFVWRRRQPERPGSQHASEHRKIPRTFPNRQSQLCRDQNIAIRHCIFTSLVPRCPFARCRPFHLPCSKNYSRTAGRRPQPKYAFRQSHLA